MEISESNQVLGSEPRQALVLFVKFTPRLGLEDRQFQFLCQEQFLEGVRTWGLEGARGLLGGWRDERGGCLAQAKGHSDQPERTFAEGRSLADKHFSIERGNNSHFKTPKPLVVRVLSTADLDEVVPRGTRERRQTTA